MLDCHLSTANGGVTMVGQTVGKYRIVSRLGRGGMGTVYKAVDETLEREVAIKVLNPDLGDPEILKRFRAEAITLARLNHPNIATFYEFAQHDDDLLMVMEFVAGRRSIACRIDSDRCPSTAPPHCARRCSTRSATRIAPGSSTAI